MGLPFLRVGRRCEGVVAVGVLGRGEGACSRCVGCAWVLGKAGRASRLAGAEGRVLVWPWRRAGTGCGVSVGCCRTSVHVLFPWELPRVRGVPGAAGCVRAVGVVVWPGQGRCVGQLGGACCWWCWCRHGREPTDRGLEQVHGRGGTARRGCVAKRGVGGGGGAKGGGRHCGGAARGGSDGGCGQRQRRETDGAAGAGGAGGAARAGARQIVVRCAGVLPAVVGVVRVGVGVGVSVACGVWGMG